MKYGLTTNNLLGIELVTIEGEIMRLGGKHLDSGDYDLMGVMTGSEGFWGLSAGHFTDFASQPTCALVGFDDTTAAATSGGCY